MLVSTDGAKDVLIAGAWRPADRSDTFRPIDPSRNEPTGDEFPVSTWADIDAALDAAAGAAEQMRHLPATQIAEFLDAYADRIDAAADVLVESAFAETSLPRSPRLADVELPRTSNQLRAAAAAARSGSWALPTIDTAAGIRSCYRPLGPVAVFGPNNFPFAFNSVAGGDFAAAIAAGNPVIGKANSSHPETTRQFAQLALEAAKATGMPEAIVQLIYRTSHADGERLVADPRIGATGYTGARAAGLVLKSAADQAGKPIYLELSSVNPVVVTAGALAERGEQIGDDYRTSVLMGVGQFCTNPGLVILPAGDAADQWISRLADQFAAAQPGTLLSPSVASSLTHSIDHLKSIGADVRVGGRATGDSRCAVENTLLVVEGDKFLSDTAGFQTEAFGNACVIVRSRDVDQMVEILRSLEGNLTGSIYSASDDSESADVDKLTFALEPKVGRLLNDKMPTGVAVSPAMNHGGPFPATGHPGFTAVGVPGAMLRFGKLTSFDNVRPGRLPRLLQDPAVTDQTVRMIDGQASTAAVKPVA